MFHLGSFENSLRSDPKKRIVRRGSDGQQRSRTAAGPKTRPPRIVGVQAKKAALRSSESLTDSAVDVSSQEETDVNDSLVSLIWRLGKPKEKLSVNEFEELCNVDVHQANQEEKSNHELETLLDSLKTVDVVQKSWKVKDLITNFETKSCKKVISLIPLERSTL